MLLPPLYAPFYGQMASDLNSLGTAICFSILTAIALTSLFETISQIEDPFVGIIALDGIDIYQELQVGFMDIMMAWRKQCFPNAKPFVLPHFPPHSTLLSAPHLRLLQSDDH
jgi:hypothetical protein